VHNLTSVYLCKCTKKLSKCCCRFIISIFFYHYWTWQRKVCVL